MLNVNNGIEMIDLKALVSSVEDAVKNLPLPTDLPIPPWLLFCMTKRRTGMSVSRAISNIYAWAKSAGIPTENGPDGSPNLIMGLSGAITKSIMDEICDNGFVVSSCAPGDILIEASGGNAGGPVTVVGTNIGFSTLRGLFR